MQLHIFTVDMPTKGKFFEFNYQYQLEKRRKYVKKHQISNRLQSKQKFIQGRNLLEGYQHCQANQHKDLLTPSASDSSNSNEVTSIKNSERTGSVSYVENSGRKIRKRSTLKAQKQIKGPQQEGACRDWLKISRQNSMKKQSGWKNYSIINTNAKNQLMDSDMNFKNKFKAYRINRLVQLFIDKLKRVSINRDPLIYEPFNFDNDRNFAKGISLNKYIFYAFLLFSILVTLANSFLATFLIAFPSYLFQPSLNYFNLFSLIWILFQIVLGFVLEREKGPDKLKRIRDIAECYLRTQFIFDFLFLMAVLVRYAPELSEAQHLFQIFVFFKIKDAMQKLKTLQIRIMQFSYQEQFWGFFKMFVTNFFLFHFIAITLLLISRLQPDQNWMIAKKIQNSDWWEQYGWAFYWAATTMLTVGFGDITPANLKQALALVAIQVFSCMTLAYNINLMGKVLQQMQKNNIQKHKNMKILRKVCDQNQLQNDLQFKLLNHIKQSHKIQTKFNFQQKNNLLKKLPNSLKTEYLRESNFKILSRIQFLKNLSHKTIYKIAQKLNEKMSHPWQIVSQQVCDDIVILREGKIGIFPCFKIKKNQQIQVNCFCSTKNATQTLISMNFVRRQFVVQNYQMKSVGYSIIKWISKDCFLDVLRQRAQDIQFFSAFIDKQRKDLHSDFQLVKCVECKRNHTKFDCPRLHYSPIVQKIIYAYTNDFKKSRTQRKQKFKRNKLLLNCLILYKTAFDNPTFEHFRTSQLQLYDFVAKNTTSSKEPQVRKQLDWNAPQNKILQQSIKHEIFGLIDFRKSFDHHFWINQVDKAHDFQFYFPQSNPKQLEKINIKKLQLRKVSSINRAKTLARKTVS